MQLEGKVALITGGGTGIGAAVAQRFVAEGAKVVITGRRREMLEEVAKSVPAGSVAIFCGDVTEEGNAQKMVEAALGFSGKLDILVNNAAIEINKAPSSTWTRPTGGKMLEINLTGPFLMMKAAIPKMIEGGGGSIINVASVAGVVAPPGAPAYCATKAGVIHLTKQVALDYGKQDVRCNVGLPGPRAHQDARGQLRAHGGGPQDRHGRGLQGDGRARAAGPHRRTRRTSPAVRLPGERRLELHDRVDGA